MTKFKLEPKIEWHLFSDMVYTKQQMWCQSYLNERTTCKYRAPRLMQVMQANNW